MKCSLPKLIKSVTPLAVAAALSLIANKSSATVLAGWDTHALPGGANNFGPSPFAAAASSPNVTVGGLTRGAGVGTTGTGAARGWGGNSWSNATATEVESVVSNQFATFTITPNTGFSVSFTNVSVFDYRRSGTGPTNGALQYAIGAGSFVDAATVSYTNSTSSGSSVGPINLSGISALQNIPSGTTVTFRIVNWGATSSGGTWYLFDVANTAANDLEIQGTIGTAGGPPHITSIAPTSVTTNVGNTVNFTVSATGDPPTYFWYKVSGGATNPIPSATTGTLTLANVLGSDTANYFVILTNASGADTSSIVSLTVTGDPTITVQPKSTQGLTAGTATFSASVLASSPTYQWYRTDPSGVITAIQNNGPTGSGSSVSGATTATLSIANLGSSDPTNFVLVVSNSFGSVTSSVASLTTVANHAMLAYWDFNGSEFTNSASSISNPAPYVGSGTAFAVGTANNPGSTPFSGAVDPIDGPGFALNNHLPNFSWGTSTYPTNGNPANNKTAGVQFNVSTVGAKDVTVTYDSRPSATASVYERLQYTTDGSTWIDFPASTTFGIGHGATFSPFSYNLSGFPGVANNPNFAVRIVSELENTASYGITANTNYVGANNTYGQTGTITYDIVTISGDAITNANIAPTVSTSPDTNTAENVPLTLNFTVGDANDGANNVTLSAQSLNPSKLNPSFVYGGSGASRTIQVIPNGIPDSFDAAPILVTATDNHGDVGVSWFILTVSAINLPPTNSLTSVKSTNTIAGVPITIPFTVGDDHTAGSITVSASSDNTTLVSSVVPGGSGANRTVTITPTAGKLGMADIYVTVNDNDGTFPKSTTATIALMVRPNTNVLLIDHFTYDNSGGLDTIASNTWKHLSGPFNQMQVNSGVVTVNTFDNTENVQATLLGAPYSTNGPTALYSSFIVNMTDSSKMPLGNGTYFAMFNDGSGTTANVEGRVVIATNGAASGNYRLGIANIGNTALNSQMLAQDLLQNTPYVVVTKLVVSNGVSTLWVSPLNESSPSVTDSSAVPPESLFNMADFELRESGANGGSISVSKVRVGTTFDSVFPSPQIQTIGGQTVVTWSDPTVTLQSATSVFGPFSDVIGATSPYTNTSPATIQFYRFKP